MIFPALEHTMHGSNSTTKAKLDAFRPTLSEVQRLTTSNRHNSEYLLGIQKTILNIELIVHINPKASCSILAMQRYRLSRYRYLRVS